MTLSTRSAPSIPPSSLAYEPLVKAVLSHRLLSNIFSYSAAYILLSTSIWCQNGGPWAYLSSFAILRPQTIVYALSLWCSGVFPVLIMRKAHLKSSSMRASSPLNVLRTAIRSNTLRSGLLTYIMSSLAFMAFHIVSSNAYQSHTQHGLRLFVKSKKHPYYLNGRVIFILTSQIVHASIFFLRNILQNRFSASQMVTHQRRHPSLFAKTITHFATVLASVMLGSSIHLVLFMFGRSVQLPIMFKVPILSHALQPFAAHFLKSPWSVVLFSRHLPLIMNTFALGLLTVSAWEFSEVVFDFFLSEPVSIKSATTEPFITLISGITSADVHFKFFAYHELLSLAAEQSQAATARRAAFFADQKFYPSPWSHLVREVLLQLGKDYQFLLRRGQAPSPVPPPVVKLPISVPAGTPSTPLIRKQIFKSKSTSPIQSVIDSLASDGQVSQAADLCVSHVPEIFRSIESVAPPVNVSVVEVKKAETKMMNFAGTLRTKVSELGQKYTHPASLEGLERARTWWSRERIDKITQFCVGNKEIDVLIVGVLSHLVCASLTEDKYGVVQRDIPKILEAFLSFLSAVEEYRAEIYTRDTLSLSSEEDIAKLTPDELRDKEIIREEVMKAGEMLSILEDGLKEGIIRIIVTFGDMLSAFTFPPRIAQKLQGYVDYS